MMRNWAGLPHNIMDEILDRLVDLSDYIRFGSVCVSWRSATLDNRNHRGKKNQVRAKYLDDDYQLPMLMVPHWSWEDDRAKFYSVTQDKILNDFQPMVPLLHQEIYWFFFWMAHSCRHQLCSHPFQSFLRFNYSSSPCHNVERDQFR